MSLSSAVAATKSGEIKQRTLLGHPVGLYVLFFTEMWERFSYYGMRALLILYMLNYFKMSQREASGIYKWYTSLVYLTPLLGGYLADRYLGNKRAVIIGAVLMAIGHFLMAFEAKVVFYSALVFLILGNGFFKPNMSTQVGRLYPQNDARRDGAYTIFYMGINLGAFLSPLICGWLAENTLGEYHSGFTVAGIGMVCGLCIYLFGLRWVIELKPEARRPEMKEMTEKNGPTEPASEAITRPTSTIRSASKETGDFPGPVQEDVQRVQLSGAGEGTGEEGVEVPEPLPERSAVLTEDVAERTPSVLPFLNRMAPAFMIALGASVAVGAPLLGWTGFVAWNTVIALEIGAISALISAWIIAQVHQAVRDRVLAIYVLGVFVVFFWAAFEQAGNAMNIWADKVSDRYLTTPMQPPRIYPEVKEAAGEETKLATAEAAPTGGFWDRWANMFKVKAKPAATAEESGSVFDPVPTAWFQSINALAIFILAPLFAVMWTWLDRRGLNPSIPTKMAIGVLLMALSFAVMIGAAKREDQPTSVRLQGDSLPAAIKLNAQNQLCQEEAGALEPYHAGRLTYDPQTHTLQMRGVLPDLDRDLMARATAPPDFVAKVKELADKTQNNLPGTRSQVILDREPPGLDSGAGLRYAGFSKREVGYDPATRTLWSTVQLADKDIKALLVAGGEPQFRATLDDLMVKSSAFRVSSWWLFWFYILATLGELCLSPVGLSMVSKLAPAKFATMLMGLWLLTSFFGGFAAGAFGEIWGTVAPTPYFIIFLAALGGASLVLFLLVRKVVAMMHGVN
jgi:POT family proton-dependent oligopeptide transporter